MRLKPASANSSARAWLVRSGKPSVEMPIFRSETFPGLLDPAASLACPGRAREAPATAAALWRKRRRGMGDPPGSVGLCGWVKRLASFLCNRVIGLFPLLRFAEPVRHDGIQLSATTLCRSEAVECRGGPACPPRTRARGKHPGAGRTSRRGANIPARGKHPGAGQTSRRGANVPARGEHPGAGRTSRHGANIPARGKRPGAGRTSRRGANVPARGERPGAGRTRHVGRTPLVGANTQVRPYKRKKATSFLHPNSGNS